MRRSLLVSAAVGALILTGSSEARAQGPAQPGPWTGFSTTLIATGADVWVRFFGAEAVLTSSLFYFCTASCDQFLFQNNNTAMSNPGDEVKVNGTFTLGQEVVFRLFVAGTNDNWFTGDMFRNSDGQTHFATQAYNDLTANAPYSVLGGFEDVVGGGDRDYNDLMFEFGGVSTNVTATPEPASLALMGTGLVGLAGFTYRRRRANKA